MRRTAPAIAIPLLVLLLLGGLLVTPPAPAKEPKPESALTKQHASAFAKLALKGASKEYPHKPGIVFAGERDVKRPKELHPAFHGCFDWHSAVHGHWLLVRVVQQFPDLPEAKEIRTVLNGHLTAENLKAEADYFARVDAKSFERPYGWTWLLKLAEELHTWDDPDAKKWSANLKPLAELIANRYIEFFPKQTYPIRAGVHANTAFGLAFAHDYALRSEQETPERDRGPAKTYYGKDGMPRAMEPTARTSSAEPCEADLMRRVLPAAEFREWFHKYLPGAARGEPATLFAPATVTDRTTRNSSTSTA